jgi:serine/threonine-protein kinase HipA
MTSPTQDLVVLFASRVVGTLGATADGSIRFTYATSWRDPDDTFPISVSLPIREEPYVGGAAHTFFANLLPEGHVREAVCRRLGISEDNDLALLRAIGGECAGALTIQDQAIRGDASDHDYELLNDKRLQSLVSDDSVVPLLVGGETTRLSLAGAQDKVPVAVLDGKIHLPLERAPSTHILKLPHQRYAHLPTNEAYVLGLAKELAFDVVRAELFTRTDPPSLLVERYDRRPSDDPWPVTRLHQEDLCQTLGLPASRKYEQEGGPSMRDAIRIVRENVVNPVVDVRRVLEWQAFNVVVGNSDGHGKNLSILYEHNEIRLAPFYDLVSTRHYERLDPLLAMGIGGTRNPDELLRARWVAFAKDLEMGAAVVIDIVRTVAERAMEAVEPWTKEFRRRHGSLSVLQTLPKAIIKRAKKLRTSIDK